MKTNELIRQLQLADPGGELEACVDNIDIHFVSREPAYYDGKLEVLIRDPKEKYYNICGAEFRREGYKIQIQTLSIRDALWENPDLPITGSHYDLEKWRREARECKT